MAEASSPSSTIPAVGCPVLTHAALCYQVLRGIADKEGPLSRVISAIWTP